MFTLVASKFGESKGMSLKVEKIYKSDEEWKDLTPEQFRVLRKEGTEPPSSSLLNKRTKRRISVPDVRCLYLPRDEIRQRYWPSFFTSIEGLETKRDKLIFPVQNITVLVAKVIRVIYLKMVLSQQVNDGANNGAALGLSQFGT